LAPDFPDVKEDKLYNYEIGMKGRGLNGSLSFEGAIFYMDWQDVQQSAPTFVPALNTIVNALVNGKGQSGFGAEAGLRIDPLPGIGFTLNASWNGLEYDADTVNIASGALINKKGARPALSPEWTVNSAVDYQFPMKTLEGLISVAASYLSERPNYISINNELVNAAGDNSTVVRASIGVRSDKGWMVSLFGENLTNEDSSLPFFTDVPQGIAFRNRPRTIGVQVEYRL
jgi:outer membrane receptor protein involved in Fe transport